MCLSKRGVRDIEVFDQALLAKQAWIILQNPNTLYSQVMRSKYFENDDLLSASLPSRTSFAWRCFLHGRDLLVKGLTKMVGNGSYLNVWTDSWINDGNIRRPLMKKKTINDIDLCVCDLIDYVRRDWIKEKLEALFYPEDVASILKTSHVVFKEDFWVWIYNKSGEYSVKSGYWMQNQITNARLHTKPKPCTQLIPLKLRFGL